MIFWLIQRLSLPLPPSGADSNSAWPSALIVRVGAAAVTAWLILLFIGPSVIRLLKTRVRERIVSDSARLNELQSAKQGTPTMGGLLIMAAVLVSTLLWADISNSHVTIGLAAAVGLTVLGAADDAVKLRSQRKGLTVRQKLAGQGVISLGIGCALAFTHRNGVAANELVVPVAGWAITLGPLFALWCAFVVIGSSNAVNLTDGLDGLAAGCAIFTGAGLTAVILISTNSTWADAFRIRSFASAGEFAILTAALVGALAGFLKFNRHPARLFMGDAGSLPIGGLLAVAALVCRQEFLLIILGGVFVIETLSVILQVLCFKLTGQRLIRCSPLHNHYLFRGDHETRIVRRFWIGSAVLVISGIAGLRFL